jgi:hypothetical protein
MAWRPGRLRKVPQDVYEQNDEDADDNNNVNDIRHLHKKASPNHLSRKPLPDLIDYCTPCDRLVSEHGSNQQ